ncbi:MAG TPA: maleylpyruvate isomerase N-terminal domain-containing protein, partial [Candidatus Saccharimonadales bacterium]|nr:maleylpyruvate isomerase N-terminal domain-containing protein [Candidatus Saccharimonadales bacterium]
PWIAVLRRSHDQVVARATGLDADALRHDSYCTGWDVAQVLSHLGSQAEMFGVLLSAGLSGEEPPGHDALPPIWDAWNARGPESQARDSIAANETLVERLEALDPEQIRSFQLSAFRRELDLAGLLQLRMSEHPIHAWDVEVSFNPGATVLPGAVELLVDYLPVMAARVGKPSQAATTLLVLTTEPERRFALVTDGVRLEPWSEQTANGALQIPAEALLRLVYGRLDSAHTPALELDTPDARLDDLRKIFPGF